ncbi:unnamed protein product [Dibothriocephalus latus]|uniref:Phosphoadenosine phosphosulphate reductase domain-containing protein n=1 Tax=Dibothriocephalus latus TaxID=60516 RepID=A0A3P7R0L9_DIBLA|nr:unnamed protein product [Dibothriocephalus latus]
MLSFNGGKDCTALLHILFAVLNKSTVAPSSPSFSSDDSDETELTASAPVAFSHPRLLYVRVRSPFPETEVFVQSVLRYYHYPSAAVKRRFLSCDWFGDFSVLSAPLSNNGPNATETSFLLIYEGPIKAGLVRLKTDAPDVEAIFMGTRSSDPWAVELLGMDTPEVGIVCSRTRSVDKCGECSCRVVLTNFVIFRWRRDQRCGVGENCESGIYQIRLYNEYLPHLSAMPHSFGRGFASW